MSDEEDTHEWIAKLHREAMQLAAAKLPPSEQAAALTGIPVATITALMEGRAVAVPIEYPDLNMIRDLVRDAFLAAATEAGSHE